MKKATDLLISDQLATTGGSVQYRTSFLVSHAGPPASNRLCQECKKTGC